MHLPEEVRMGYGISYKLGTNGYGPDPATREVYTALGAELPTQIDDTTWEVSLREGADGMVPGFANVDPARYRALWDACTQGKWEHAVAIQEEINAEFQIVFKPSGRGGDGTGVGAFKIAMSLLGVIDSPTQPRPLADFTDDDISAVREVLASTGLLP